MSLIPQNNPSMRHYSATPKRVGGAELRLLVVALSVVAILLNVLVAERHEQRTRQTSRVLQQSLPAPTTESGPPKLVWLMSFPNSGTSFTSRLVRDATLTLSASNYADETPEGQEGISLPVYEDQPTGPFWIKPESSPEFTEPSNYILTKTHCGMRCTLCPPEKYGESSYSFRRRCLTSKWMEIQNDGSKQRTFSAYKPDRIAKAVHLIRDPFNNIVSRYHLERKITGRTAKDFEQSREGFRAYCASVETLHYDAEKRVSFLDDEILQLLINVPCHEDFLRYIEWHNLAFITADDLGLPSYVLHYEWFTTRFRAATKELLQFLEMEQRAEPTQFVAGRSYNYYTPEERASVKEAFKLMASPQTWWHVAQYFDNNVDDPTSIQ